MTCYNRSSYISYLVCGLIPYLVIFAIGGWGRYLDELMKLKDQAHAEKNEFITWNDIQACVDHVNLVVQEEHESEYPGPIPPGVMVQGGAMP